MWNECDGDDPVDDVERSAEDGNRLLAIRLAKKTEVGGKTYLAKIPIFPSILFFRLLTRESSVKEPVYHRPYAPSKPGIHNACRSGTARTR